MPPDHLTRRLRTDASFRRHVGAYVATRPLSADSREAWQAVADDIHPRTHVTRFEIEDAAVRAGLEMHTQRAEARRGRVS